MTRTVKQPENLNNPSAPAVESSPATSIPNVLEEVTPTPESTPIPTNASGSTYTSTEYGFSFTYPKGYKVEERSPGFFVITTADEHVPQGGISVDARMQDVYKTFDGAVKDVNETYSVTSSKKINEWTLFDAEGKDGMLKGTKFRIALIPYKTGALSVQTIDVSPYSGIFEDLVRGLILLD